MHRLLCLRSSTPFIVKHLSTTSSTDASASLTLHFLKASCGLPPETALSVSKKIHLKSTKNPHAVLALLKSYNFPAPRIAKLVSRLPRLLLSDPDKTLKPKLDFLESIGFSGPALVSLVSSVPVLLQFSLENTLVRNFNLLKGLLRTEADIMAAIKSCAWVLVSNFDKTLLPEMKSLEDYGVPMNVRLRMLTMHSRSLVDRNNRFLEIFDTVKKSGISPTSPIFAHAFGVLVKLPERIWERKVDNFRKLGWSEEQVMVAFAKHPYCMSASPQKIVKNMEFYRDNFGWDPEYVSKNSVVLSFSFEKRVLPRSRVLAILKSKGVLKGEVVARHLMLGEKEFLNKYVMKYCEQLPEIANDEAIRNKIEELRIDNEKQALIRGNLH